MQVSIIGTGNMAAGIGTRLVKGGHDVIIHAKDEAKGKGLADALGGSVKVAGIGAKTAQVVIVATPYTEMSNVAKEFDGLAGKVVVDITNPVDFATFQLIPEAGKSGAEEVAKLFPEAQVVKAFNTVFNQTLETGEVDGYELDVLLAGDDQTAKDTVKELVQSSGMRPLDVGPLAYARHLEGIGLIHMALQDQLGTGWKSALKFIG